MPNMRVFRPADAIETAECWQLALERSDGPTVLALTRQNLPQLRTEAGAENLCAAGAYEIAPAEGKAKATLFASGSEVEIALAAQKLLSGRGMTARVVSVPSLDLLLAQPEPIRAPDHRRCAGQGRDRGGGALRLGRGHRPRRRSSSA